MGQPSYLEKGRWPQRALFRLIDEWRKNEILYNTSIPANKKNTARNKAVTSILRTINQEFPKFPCTSALIKHKLKMLRTQYAREIRRMKFDKHYRPKFSIFAELDFLREFTGERTEKESYTTKETLRKHSSKSLDNERLEDSRASDSIKLDVDPLDSDDCSHLSDIEIQQSDLEPEDDNDEGAMSADEMNATDFALDSASEALQLLTQNVMQSSIESAFEQYVKNEMLTIKDNVLKTEMREKITSIIKECKRKDSRYI